MKATTRNQKAIEAARAAMARRGRKAVTLRQERWIKANAFKGTFRKVSEENCRCCQCGRLVTHDAEVCPACGNRRRYTYNRTRGYIANVVAITDYYGDWQIIRHIEIRRTTTRGKIETMMWVVVENWVSVSGKREIIARTRNVFGGTFFVESNLEFRREPRGCNSYYTECYEYYDMVVPDGRIQPMFRTMGLPLREKDFGGMLVGVAERLAKDRLFESMVKLGHTGMARARIRYERVPDHCWRLALRYGYKTEHWMAWNDYVEQLLELGYDTHNPRVLLPENLENEHQRLTNIVNRKRDAERMRKEAEQARANDARYKELRGKYLGIRFSSDGLDFHVLQSPMEFLEEGRAMHHCVATYWSHQDSLILSARDEQGKRVETVEVSLRTFRIVQSQGPCNKPTERHESVMGAVMKNMESIKKVARTA